jgi:hypothetical protein
MPISCRRSAPARCNRRRPSLSCRGRRWPSMNGRTASVQSDSHGAGTCFSIVTSAPSQYGARCHVPPDSVYCFDSSPAIAIRRSATSSMASSSDSLGHTRSLSTAEGDDHPILRVRHRPIASLMASISGSSNTCSFAYDAVSAHPCSHDVQRRIFGFSGTGTRSVPEGQHLPSTLAVRC